MIATYPIISKPPANISTCNMKYLVSFSIAKDIVGSRDKAQVLGTDTYPDSSMQSPSQELVKGTAMQPSNIFFSLVI
jgi:hypothetical protein